MELKEIFFGGAMLSVFIVFFTFILSLSIFLWKWSIDIIDSFKKDFNRGYKDAMESE